MIETYRTILGMNAIQTENSLFGGDRKPISILIRMEGRDGQLFDIEVDSKQAECLKIGQRVKITLEVVD